MVAEIRTNQTNDNNNGGSSRRLVTFWFDIGQAILRADGSTPVHSRHSASKDDGRDGSFPQRRSPGGTKDEEHGESNDASNDGDDCRTDNICEPVDAYIVGDGGIAQVVHTADSSAAEEAADADPPPRHTVIRSDNEEGGEENEDGNEERYCGKATRVCDL